MGKSWRINPHIVCDFALVIILQLNSFSMATASNKSCLHLFLKKGHIRIVCFNFFSPWKRREGKDQTETEVYKIWLKMSFPPFTSSLFLCPRRGGGKKARTVKNKFTTLSFHVPFLSLWDIMALSWSIIPHPPWQFLNTNFPLPTFLSHSLLSVWQLIVLLLFSQLCSHQMAQLKVRAC